MTERTALHLESFNDVCKADLHKRCGEETEFQHNRCTQRVEERKDLLVNSMILASEMSSRLKVHFEPNKIFGSLFLYIERGRNDCHLLSWYLLSERS